VNESYEKFGVNQHGEIRFGLAAIKGLGDSAAMAIITEREKNGPYKSIFNFAERVNLNSVNRKAFESLALSGGFDSFGIRREDFFAQNGKGEVFLDTLLRYGCNYQAEQQEMRFSLFGGDNAVEIATPPIPKGDTWSDIERLNKERELIGIYLSAHPLDAFRIILDNLCNTRCNELGAVENLEDREEIILGGIVTGVQTKLTKTGKTCGFVTIEDFDTSGQLAFFGEEWVRWSSWFSNGAALCINAKLVERWRDSNQKELRVQKIEYLQTVKDNAFDHITISMDTGLLNDQIVSELSGIIDESPGKTKLFFQLHDSLGKNSILLESHKGSVNLTMPLLYFIQETEGLEYFIN